MKKLLPVLAFLLVCTALYLLLRQSHDPGMRGKKPDLSVEAPTLFADFVADESAANEKYLNKVLVVTGTVQGFVSKNSGPPTLRLETNSTLGSIECDFDQQTEHRRQEFPIGEPIKLKCICMDFYRDLKLVNCVEL